MSSHLTMVTRGPPSSADHDQPIYAGVFEAVETAAHAAPRRSATASSGSARRRRGREAAADHLRRIPRRGRRAVDTWPYRAEPGLPGPCHERPGRPAMGSPDDLLTAGEVAPIMGPPGSALAD